ncbi:MAG: sigma-54 dependent transcriptional regulator [Spirochaetes bacterium]|nr:sigma-54 dependent transcriptional regulator [Spirochaetota bacterium]
MKRILIVDDEANMAAALEMLFQGHGFETRTALNGRQALEFTRNGERFDVVLSDMKMPVMGGMELLKCLRDENAGTPFVLITAYGTVEKAVEAMKMGAVDVITKPFTNEMILALVSRVCRMESLKEENKLLRRALKHDSLIYASRRMEAIVSVIQKVGPVSTPVLITGESGTGKEIVARMLHEQYAGGFDRKPFVSVNCPAVPESLMESELFGYRKGAFTGAERDFNGRVSIADGGTLFFDEIGDMPLAIQPKLLRLLENKTYEPLGTAVSRNADLRVLCATNKDLKRMVLDGKFRDDLFYRINAITIALPALRERPEDIPVLAKAQLERSSREIGKAIEGFTEEAMTRLSRYPWPGNVRELKNVIERAVVLCTGDMIGFSDLPAELGEPVSPSSEDCGENRLESVERRLLIEALEGSGWNVSEAARKLGITRNTIRYRIQKHGLDDGRISP